MARTCLSMVISLCLLGLWMVTPASAQGLLGSGYSDSEFVYYRPNDANLNRLDHFIHGVQSNVNLPLLRNGDSYFGLDAYGRFRGLWMAHSEGSPQLDTGVRSLNANFYDYSGGTNLYFRGWQNVRPWIGAGYHHSDVRLKGQLDGDHFSNRDREDGFLFTVGVEANVFPMLAVRHSLEFQTAKFNGSDFENPDYLAELIISPPMNHWYLRLGGFIDFDGNGGGLAGLGVRF